MSSDKSSYGFLNLFGNIHIVLGLFMILMGIAVGITSISSGNTNSISRYGSSSFEIVSLLPAGGILFLGLSSVGFGELLLAIREMVFNSRNTMEMTANIQENTLKQSQILEKMMLRQVNKPPQSPK